MAVKRTMKFYLQVMAFFVVGNLQAGKAWLMEIEPIGVAGGVALKSTDPSARNEIQIESRLGDVIMPKRDLRNEIAVLNQGDFALVGDWVFPWDSYGKMTVIAFDENMDIINYVEIFEKNNQVIVSERMTGNSTPLETKYATNKNYKMIVDVEGRLILVAK